MFHARNTEAEVEILESTVCAFAEEMIHSEEADDGVQGANQGAAGLSYGWRLRNSQFFH